MARARRRPSRAAGPPAPRPSRVSGGRILAELRLASRKGDRAALELALAQMRTLAHSPRYWEKYLGLLRSPLARLVDLLVVKQGDRIAHLKGWKVPAGGRRPPAPPSRGAPGERAGRRQPSVDGRRGPGPNRPAPRRRRGDAGPTQPSLFDPSEAGPGASSSGSVNESRSRAASRRSMAVCERRGFGGPPRPPMK